MNKLTNRTGVDYYMKQYQPYEQVKILFEEVFFRFYEEHVDAGEEILVADLL